jgi:hypothetical protein
VSATQPSTSRTWSPSTDHSQFDALCAQVGEWEPLLSVTQPAPVAPQPAPDAAQPAPDAPQLDHHAAQLDHLILAGLVCPY